MRTDTSDMRAKGHARRRSKRSGVTVVEMLLVCLLACTVILASTAMLTQSMDTWSGRTSQTFSDDDCAIAVQRVQRDLQSALWFEIATDGQGVTYTLPAHDPDDPDSYLLPPEPERDASGNIIYHSFYREGEQLLSSDSDRPILRSCPLADPDDGSEYDLFAVVSGTNDVIRIHFVSAATTGKTRHTTRLVQDVHCRNLQ